MNIDLDNMPLEALTDGFRFDPDARAYTCLECGETFEEGEAYRFGERFLLAPRAVRAHVRDSHAGRFSRMLGAQSRYVSLTQNQRALLALMHEGQSDKQIAQRLGVTPATVRRQRFAFREKAKQAKMYLAIWEQAAAARAPDERHMLPIHAHATMVDDRYDITLAEHNRILASSFESLSPLKLKAFPAKEKRKIVVLAQIADLFEHDKRYPEKYVNEIIKGVYFDFATIRRYLIEYGFMDRTADCREYWLK